MLSHVGRSKLSPASTTVEVAIWLGLALGVIMLLLLSTALSFGSECGWTLRHLVVKVHSAMQNRLIFSNHHASAWKSLVDIDLAVKCLAYTTANRITHYHTIFRRYFARRHLNNADNFNHFHHYGLSCNTSPARLTRSWAIARSHVHRPCASATSANHDIGTIYADDLGSNRPYIALGSEHDVC